MKNTSKFSAFAAMIVAAAACLCSFASCNKAGEIVETDREEGTTAMYYCIGLSAWVGAGMGVSAPAISRSILAAACCCIVSVIWL